MSAQTLRAPAGVGQAARAYLRLLAHRGTVIGLVVGGHFLPAWVVEDHSWLEERLADDAFYFLRVLGMIMFFLPLLHWRWQGGRHALQAALPLGRTQDELVRVGCGTAWAAITLGLPLALHTWQVATFHPEDTRSLSGYPLWYPLSLFVAGITLYLLGSAVLLRSERPGRVLLLAFVLFIVAVGWMPAPLLPVVSRAVVPPEVSARLLFPFQDRDDLARLGTLEWLVVAGLGMGLACATVYASIRVDHARVPGPVQAVGRVAAAVRRGLCHSLPRGSPRRPVRPSGLRRPPSAFAVVRRQFVLLSRRMTWPMLIALFIALDAVRMEMEPGRTVPRFAAFSHIHVLAVLCWSLIVWVDERDRMWEYNEALPVGPVKKRILYAAAGAAWLLLACLLQIAGRLGGAVAAGTLTSPAQVPVWLWLGMPCGALTLYLFGTLPTLLFRRPGLSGFVLLLLWDLDRVRSSDNPLAPDRALAPFVYRLDSQLSYASAWSYGTAAFWLAVCAAAAAWVLVRSAWADRARSDVRARR